jgi:hypothetical protein
MTGGTISGNTASLGNGVYVGGHASSAFNMEGSAVVAAGNDAYLSAGKIITLTGALTGAAPVATITVPDANYVVGTRVLAESPAGGSLVLNNYGKFAVTPKGAVWYVDSDGKLTQTQP